MESFLIKRYFPVNIPQCIEIKSLKSVSLGVMMTPAISMAPGEMKILSSPLGKVCIWTVLPP